MHACTICGDDTGLDGPCRFCYWSGAALAREMAGPLGVVARLTGTDWHTEHTGGGCFWLRTEVPGGHLILTEWPDVLTGTRSRRASDWRGWYLTGVTDAYLDGDEDGPVTSAPDPDVVGSDDRGLGDEDLARAIGEAVAALGRLAT